MGCCCVVLVAMRVVIPGGQNLVVVFIGCSQNRGEGDFTEKDKGFRGESCAVRGDKSKLNLKDLRA